MLRLRARGVDAMCFMVFARGVACLAEGSMDEWEVEFGLRAGRLALRGQPGDMVCLSGGCGLQ